MSADPRATALFLGAFFDELARWGVHDMVVSPGSRSTPLTMTAFELSRREPGRLRVFVDVDERGAAFFALGLAKASGHPAAVVCTSGTAVANYYPAVMEAESSRVPLVVLTGDRPPRLQGLGAPQTCDQLNAYGNHVRAFRQMPLPSADGAALAFARQAAREAVIAAGEECFGGPVHLNFPFDEPLKPDFSAEGLFESARRLDVSRETSVPVSQQLAPSDAGRLAALLADRRALVYAGEGTCTGELEAGKVLNWARAFRLPLLADPLSGLRSSDDPLVIDNYDSVLGPGGAAPDGLAPEVVVRFGRYPVSKKATQLVAAARPVQIVVDPLETRDCNAATDVFVRCRPSELAGSLGFAYDVRTIDYDPDDVQRAFARAWIDANDAARKRIASVDDAEAGFEGAFVRRVVELAPEGSCLFSANSMSVRALDTFYLKSAKRLAVLCNRGLNGIDGTVSTALGAAQHFAQTTLVTGDLTLLHDLNALALQRELRLQREAAACFSASLDAASSKAAGAVTPGHATDAASDNVAPGAVPSIVIVLLNNNGGGIFDMLPQKSEDPYFERLFLTPQDVDFRAAAQAFGVPYRRADTVPAFDEAYRALLGTPGISLVEVRVPLSGLKDRYAPYW
ncbi:2-succinyl-5-enolpyruvyl-6-hydroxy-3-cyclohexene-1-carboxylic-acid synthase [Gordonibacter pamelaeae]|uniref:2-succinyl-5-enolpyruvyl-6-hydroxy-3-cyclohexene-1-carboxylate synthase n=3 Tax=Gordonibacter pamelaeae TaxID=471189 RepID=A0A369LU19_9ACTN|nr:2-succinyl-5-enolpyruvyl-6-hydroxy-3-cyclohexene-1-carboxylic-acid synthase [Gordonibacter pamelaeae]MCB6310673.1 2-succinyl-5-enolpyruvyl-6-hydroxy-3-cyclohexene-1-carboxylic-acid synthase [Gordonibacter pamelaeae]RDB63033.1 2-succinyl-5-enolpyruvyl-6-hydroxy-3-cyclohexene-1-carboxylic-acid synthase [Gordonibacter pamelaeae]